MRVVVAAYEQRPVWRFEILLAAEVILVQSALPADHIRQQLGL